MLVRHVCRVVYETVRFAIAERRVSIFLAIVVGLVVVAAAFAAQTAAPFAIYPFL
jgi:hypothetical protein